MSLFKSSIIVAAILLLVGLGLAFAPCEPCTQSQRITAKIELDIAAEEAWQTLKDFSNPQYFVPGVIGVDITSSRKDGVGASRRVSQRGGNSLDETVVEWRYGEGYTVALEKNGQPMPPTTASYVHYQIERTGMGSSQLLVVIDTRWPMQRLGQMIYHLFVRDVLAQNMTAVAAGAKHYFETGDAADPLQRSALEAQVSVE